MKLQKHSFFLLTLIPLTLVACTTNPPITNTFTGPVTKVHDGDSIHITPKGEKRVIIRLASIDAPEIKQPSGIASRDKLRSMILNRAAKAKCHKKDRYQRQVCVVYFDGEDVNLQMGQGRDGVALQGIPERTNRCTHRHRRALRTEQRQTAFISALRTCLDWKIPFKRRIETNFEN